LNIKDLYQNLPSDEKANVITHGSGLILTLLFAPFLLVSEPWSIQLVGLTVFVFGMLTMFFSSTFYHLANKEVRKNRWRIADHISIFILIGSTYTPFIFYYYYTEDGLSFLILHWCIIFFGIIFKLIFKTKYEIVSLGLYLILGWMVVFIFKEISYGMSLPVFIWLIAGGLSYTFGVFFYVRTSIPWHHAIWHVFVMLGCFGHYIALLLS
jgi:hemolysin III